MPSEDQGDFMRFHWVTGVLALLLGAGSALGATEPTKTPTVFVRKVVAEELYEPLVYPVRVLSRIQSRLLSDADGVVRRIVAPLGMPVRRGQVILEIENTDPVYRYSSVRLTAPVAGVVSGFSVTVGSRVSRGQELAALVDPAKLVIRAEVTAADLPWISAGLSGALTFRGSESVIPVRVSGVSPAVDPATGTAPCEMEVVELSGSLAEDRARHGTGAARAAPPAVSLGAAGQVRFRANPRQGIAIPDHAVVYRGAETFVRLVRESQAHKTPVTLGRAREGRIEVLKGLSPGDQLIERASGFVADGETVQVEQKASDKNEQKASGTGT